MSRLANILVALPRTLLTFFGLCVCVLVIAVLTMGTSDDSEDC